MLLALIYAAAIWFGCSVIFAVIAGKAITLRDQRETIRPKTREEVNA